MIITIIISIIDFDYHNLNLPSCIIYKIKNFDLVSTNIVTKKGTFHI